MSDRGSPGTTFNLPFNPFRRRLVLLWGLIALSFLFFVGGPDYYSPRSFKKLWDIGHILYFALLPWYLFFFSRLAPRSFRGQLILVFGLALLLGAMIEVVQAGTHRLSEFGDLFRDFIGGMVAFFFLLPAGKVISSTARRLLQLLTVGLVVIQICLVLFVFIDEYQARKNFPVLSDFESPLEKGRWKGTAGFSIADKISSGGKHSLRVVLGIDLYSGVDLFYFPRNWQGYDHFQFNIYNPDRKPVSITCRISDKEHAQGTQLFEDRFNRRYTVSTGWHTIKIDIEDIRKAPKARDMDLRNILEVGIFATRLARPRVIYLDDVRLSA